MQRISTRELVLYALFVGMIFLLGLTPLGFITLPIAAITTVHIPVIVGGYRFGVKGGALLGFFFGLTSLISCFTRPDAIAAIVLGTNTGFGVYNLLLILLVLFLPRILTGIFSALTYGALRTKNELLAMGIAAFVGSMTNTVLLLGSLYIFAFAQTGAAFGLAAGFTAAQFLKILLGIVALNGLLEAAAAVILCTAIGRALLHFEKNSPKTRQGR
jgi:uncharacterized membrane protein